MTTGRDTANFVCENQEPHPQSVEEVRRWRITDPFDRFLSRRLDVIRELFARDVYSIDAMALALIGLGSLAEHRFSDDPGPNQGKDQRRFRMLLTEHCESFTNRISIPELVRHARKSPPLAAYEAAILTTFPVEGMLQVRQICDDPTIETFNAWANAQMPRIPTELYRYDFAGCIHRAYRNAIVHELDPGDGREAIYAGVGDPAAHPIFYANHAAAIVTDPIEYTRFGIYPPYLLMLFSEAVNSVRAWALANDQDISPPIAINGDQSARAINVSVTLTSTLCTGLIATSGRIVARRQT